MEKLEIRTKPGMISLASISLRIKNRDAICLEVDCNSKYYNYLINDSGKEITILLKAFERTLRTSKRKNPTEIVINKPPGTWTVVASSDVAKYGFCIYLIRQKNAVSHFNLTNSKPMKVAL